MLLEDDFGMIDGILNNGKREPERPSVVERLRKQAVPEPKVPPKQKKEPCIE